MFRNFSLRDNRGTWFLVFILCIAGILRLYKLTEIPPNLEWDEVATGYDAYSILKTGRDQFGNFLPLTFRSLDDYKPPLYTYLTSVSIAVFGWNDFAVRFPAALLGILTIFTTYKLVLALIQNEKVALMSALFLAISPWHVNFSRLALETNSTIFFMTAGMWLFLKGLKKGKWLIVSALFFGLNLYLYHNARIFVPIILVALMILYRRELWQARIYSLIAALVLGILIIPLIPIVTSTAGQMRFQGTSIFTDAVTLDMAKTKATYQRMRSYDDANGLEIYGRLFHNQYVLFGLLIFKNYLSHFAPNFFVFTQDYPRHHAPEMGILYFTDILFLVIGMYMLIRHNSRRIWSLILVWILAAPIAASVTRDVPHALRSEIFLPMLLIAVAAGILWLIKSLPRSFAKLGIGLICLIYFIQVSFFLHKYLFHFSRETSQFWQYGNRETAIFAESVKNNYEKIVVSPRLEQPHMFFLYYLKYDPAKYLASGGTVSGGWGEQQNHFAKYYFKFFDFDKERDGKTLFIGTPKEFPTGVSVLKRINYLNGEPAVWIVEG